VTNQIAKPGKVLVVDDYSPDRVSARALLEIDAYTVIEAESGGQALEMVQIDPPDLILLDVMMPGISGFEVCQQLKQNEYTRLIPVVLVTGLNDRIARVEGIQAGADDFLTKPFSPLELLARVKSLVHQRRLNENLDHAAQALFAIAHVVESRDPNTGDHCERLVALGQSFGDFLQLSREQVRNLTWASYLHDIGKVGTPDAILLKTAALTPAEKNIMRQHVLIGEQICKPLYTLQGVVPIIRHHHERWDGSGYPDGLAGEAIPLLARIFQLLDIYDALTHERPYKPAFSPQVALQMMVDETQRGWRDPSLMAQLQQFILGHDRRVSEPCWITSASA
jgi:putative two-component system response regulator